MRDVGFLDLAAQGDRLHRSLETLEDSLNREESSFVADFLELASSSTDLGKTEDSGRASHGVGGAPEPPGVVSGDGLPHFVSLHEAVLPEG